MRGRATYYYTNQKVYFIILNQRCRENMFVGNVAVT